MPADHPEERVLIVAPLGQDSATMAAMLGAEGITISVCSDPAECLCQLQTGAGALLLTEEALELPGATELLDSLNTQPAWSELPLIILTRGGQSRLANLLDHTTSVAGSLILLERPMKISTLLRSVQVALRSRRRQHQVRDLMAEQQRQQQALHESEEQFRAMFNIASVGKAQADPVTGHFLRVNAALCRLTGYTESELLDRSFLDITHPDDRDSDRANLARLRSGKVTGFESEKRYIRPDGRLVWVHASVNLIRDAAGLPLRTTAVVQDITDQRRAQEVLSRSKEELERLVTERTAKLHELVGELEHFSYTITHDMRAPLRSIRGFAELVQELCAGCQHENQKLLLRRISTSAERMDLLITDALSYSRAVREHLPLGPVDLAALLRGMLDSYPEFQTANAHIHMDGKIPLVLGNQAGLTQVFSNLLGNAIKFTKPGQTPEIRIHAELSNPPAAPLAVPSPTGEEPGEHTLSVPSTINHQPSTTWIRVWVEDNGIGISPNMFPRIFNLFARGTTDQPGTGIGLALVRKVVDRMGGRVGVESQQGQGSRFWLELLPGDPRQSAPTLLPSPPTRPGAIL